MDLRHSALVLINFQNDFLRPRGVLHGRHPFQADPLLRRACGLLEAMKAVDRPVIWVNTVLRSDHLDSALSFPESDGVSSGDENFLVEGSWGAQVVDEVVPGKNDFVVTKKGHSAFQFTHLDRLLANLNVQNCVMAGGEVSGCLSASVRQGAALGYDMVIPSDVIFLPESSYLQLLDRRAELATAEEILSSLPAAESPAPSAGTALLVVDIQNDFVHPLGFRFRQGFRRLSPEQLDQIIGNNQRLIRAMREKGHAVVFLVTYHRRDMLDSAHPPVIMRTESVPSDDEYLLEGSWGGQLMEGLECQEGDLFIIKKGRSGFGTTSLHRTLRNLKVGRCVVTGGGIHACVEDTVREGVGLGYRFVVAADAVYDLNSPSLGVMADHAEFQTTDEVLAWLGA